MSGDANLGRAILEISTRDVDAKAGLNKFKSDAQATLKEIQAAFDKLGKSLSTSLNSSLGQLHSNLNKLEGSGKSAAAGLKSLESGVTATEKAAGNLHKTATNLGAGLQNLNKGASDAGGGIIRLGSGAAGIAVSGLEKVSSVALSAGAALAKMSVVGGAALVGLAGLGVKSAGDLQEAVNNISTIKPNIDTSAVFKSLNDISTRVPQSAKQLGDSLYNIFSSIEINQKDALALVEKFAQGAIGAQTDADTWGTAMLGVMNAYGKGLGDVDKIQDVFFNTINAGVVNGKQLASALGPVTASAKTAGLSIEDLGAAIVGVTKEGGDASQNINNLNNYLQKVTTTQAQAAMNGMGVATVDATGKFRPFTDVLTDLKGKLSTMTEAQKANALQAIFPDAQARQGAIVLMSQLDAVKASLKTNETATGSATAAYQKMASGMKAQAALLKNSVVADLTALGAGMLPAITPGISGLAKALQGQQSNFEKFGKFLGTEVTNGIVLVRDGFLTFKAALAGNWADADKIRPLHALIGNLGLIIHNDVIPAWNTFDAALKQNGETVGKLVWAFSPLSIALSTLRGFMAGGLNGAIDAFQLRVKGAEDALGGLAHALGLSDEFNTLKNIIDPTIKSVFSLVGSIGQVVDKSGAIKIAGDIAAKAFSLFGEAVQFVNRLVKENIGPLSGMVQNFGNTIKTSLDIAIATFKALEGPVSAVVRFLSPMLPLLGNVAGALVVYKVAMEGAGLATKLFNTGTGEMLISLGKVAIVIAPAIAAFEVAKAIVPGFNTTLDQLGFLAEHTGDTIRTLTGNVHDFNTSIVAQNTAIYDSTGKLIGYSKAFETGAAATKRLNDLNAQGLSFYGNSSALVDRYANSIAAVSKETSFGYSLSYRYRDALTDQLNVMTKNNSVMQYLFTSHEKLLTTIVKYPAAVQAQMGKTAELSRQFDSLTTAINGVARANDELNGKLSAAQTVITTMDSAVSQLALKHNTATIAIGETTGTVVDAYNKWKDYTAIQLAGGQGSYAAGVEAGKLKDQLVTLDKNGFTPILDATFKATAASQGYSKEIATNTIANQNLTAQQEATNKKIVESQGATAELSQILGRHGAVVTETGAKYGPAAAVATTSLGNINTAIRSTQTKIGEYNATNVQQKVFNSNVSTMTEQVKALIAKIWEFNNTPVQNKTGTITVNNVTVGSNGSYGPALPAPAPIPSPSRGQSAGLSIMGMGLAGPGGVDLGARFAQVTQQATATSFSLTGLQNQIEQIVAMFNSMDAKALKAAAVQADSVSKIAGAAGSMVDAMVKVQTYTGTSKDLMKLASDDSATMTGLYIAGAVQFNQKQLEGAALYVDTSGKVASAASSMLEALAKLPKYSGPSRDNIRDFTGNVKDLTFDFWDYSQVFNKGMLDGAGNYADTAGKVADTTGKAADALLKLKDWPPIFRGSISGFVGNLKDATFDFSEVTIFSDEQYVRAATFAETSGKVADTVGKGAGALAKLLDWPPIFRGSISGFVGNLKDVTFDFSEAMGNFQPGALPKATEFAEASGKVAETVGKGVDGLLKLNTYMSPGKPAMTLFVADLLIITTQFKDSATTFTDASGKYAPQLLTAAADFAAAGGSAAEAVGKGVEGFSKLSAYKGVAPEAITALEESMHFAVTELDRLTTDVDTAMMDKAKAFGDATGGLLTAMGNAVETLTKLEDYKGVLPAQIDGLIESIRIAVAKVSTLKEAADKDLMTKVKEFGVTTHELFDGLKSGMEVFSGLEKYKSIPVDTVNTFIQGIVDTINATGRLAAGVDQGLMTKADEFATATGNVFTKIKGSIDTFSSLEKLKDDPKNTITMLITAVDEAIKKMPQANSQAQDFFNQIDQWAKKMEEAYNRARGGLSDMTNATNIVTGAGSGGNPGDATDLSNWNPLTGSRATQALSAASSAPQLNAGISMAAPIVTNSSNSQTSSADTYQFVFPNVTSPLTRADMQGIAEAVVEKQAQKLKGF